MLGKTVAENANIEVNGNPIGGEFNRKSKK